MKPIRRPLGNRRHALFGAIVLLAVTASSEAAADGGPGPLGATIQARSGLDNSRVGPLFGSAGLDGGHFCTASVVHSKHGNLIVTAAHCLSKGTLWFAPGYRNGKAPHGVWKVVKTFVPDTWNGDQDENSDVGFAALESKDGVNLEDIVGGNRFATGRSTGATAVTVTGYPSNEENAITCTNKPTSHSHTQQRIECPDFTGGTSGSPWVNNDGEIVGILGGHEQGGSTSDVSYSIVLKKEASDLYRKASEQS